MRSTPIEALTSITVAQDEIATISEAIALYNNWLARTPASAAEHQETIVLLDRLRQRLTVRLLCQT